MWAVFFLGKEQFDEVYLIGRSLYEPGAVGIMGIVLLSIQWRRNLCTINTYCSRSRTVINHTCDPMKKTVKYYNFFHIKIVLCCKYVILDISIVAALLYHFVVVRFWALPGPLALLYRIGSHCTGWDLLQYNCLVLLIQGRLDLYPVGMEGSVKDFCLSNDVQVCFGFDHCWSYFAQVSFCSGKLSASVLSQRIIFGPI